MSDQKHVRVTVSKDGPYVVTGPVPLLDQVIVVDAEGGSESWKEGEHYRAPPNFALCRCGHSNKKPFCDGTHKTAGFDGTETANRAPYLEQAGMIDGPALALSDAESMCAFGRFCDPKGSVWKQAERSDDPHIRATFIRQVNHCPSGRLVVWDKGTGKPVEHELPVSIGLVEDPAQGCSGPIWLRGGIRLTSSDGFEYEIRNRVTLCRCGASKNKPFCDGSHASVGFHAK